MATVTNRIVWKQPKVICIWLRYIGLGLIYIHSIYAINWLTTIYFIESNMNLIILS